MLSKYREAWVVGIGITQFGFYPDKPCYEMGSKAILQAIKDSGLGWKDIQAAYCGSVYQGTGSGHQAIKELGFTGFPIVNVENACSSGSSAFRLGYQAVALGMYDTVLVLGMEKMPQGPIPSTAFQPWQLAMGFNVQPANYALESIEYMEKYGATIEDFARVTVKNRKNGALNPNARFQKPVTVEEVLASRNVAKPLRLLHCSPLADGACAFIISSKKGIKESQKAVEIAAAVMTSTQHGEAFYMSGMIGSSMYPPQEGTVEMSARLAYEDAALGPEDIDVVQAYDTMSPAELWDIEKLGFCKRGEAPRLLKEGYFDLDGKLPVNSDGGLMARGHALGATACAQIYEVVLQLRNNAGSRQISDVKAGLCHAMGAGPNSTVTILKK